jgi:flagellar motor switch/type III secretory pathway protein FliN
VIARLAAAHTVAHLAATDDTLPLAHKEERLVELLWHGQVRARGKLVAIDGHYGVQIIEIISTQATSLS